MIALLHGLTAIVYGVGETLEDAEEDARCNGVEDFSELFAYGVEDSRALEELRDNGLTHRLGYDLDRGFYYLEG